METDYHAIGVRLIPKLHLNKVYYHSDIDSSYRITYINELAIFDNEGWQIGSYAESASLFNHPTILMRKSVCSFNLTVSV